MFATAFSPDKTQGLFGGKNSAVKVWNLAEKTEIGELVGHTAGEFVLAVQWLADGRRAPSASGDWTVRLWDLPSTRETKVFKTGSGWAWSLAISPDEKLVAAGANGAVIVWSLDSGEELHRFTGHAGMSTPWRSRAMGTGSCPAVKTEPAVFGTWLLGSS